MERELNPTILHGRPCLVGGYNRKRAGVILALDIKRNSGEREIRWVLDKHSITEGQGTDW